MYAGNSSYRNGEIGWGLYIVDKKCIIWWDMHHMKYNSVKNFVKTNTTMPYIHCHSQREPHEVRTSFWSESIQNSPHYLLGRAGNCYSFRYVARKVYVIWLPVAAFKSSSLYVSKLHTIALNAISSNKIGQFLYFCHWCLFLCIRFMRRHYYHYHIIYTT